jgi:5-methylthioadenosine/S-adenosylhomocysteine deaminase
MTLLIRNTMVVVDAVSTPLDKMDILIEAGRIARIDYGIEPPPGAQVMDGSDLIAIPGFVNAHTHSNESFEQGFYDALPLEVWLAWKYPPFAVPRLPERVHYLRTMLLAIECVRSGITTVQDDLINGLTDPQAFDGSASAYRDLGLRANITVSMSDKPPLASMLWTNDFLSPDLKDELSKARALTWQEHLQLFERHFATWNEVSNDRIRVILGPIGPQWCTDDLLQASTEISKARNIPVHTHTLESKIHTVQAQEFYGRPMIEHLAGIGVLTPNFALNHAVWLTDNDIALLAEYGSSITHNPVSNLKLGCGIARIPALLKAGVPVGLGTDGTSTSDRADMFRSLGLAAMLHRVADLDYDTWTDAADAFHMATVGAARTAMLHKDVGRLAVGMKADLTLIDRYDYGLIPLKRPLVQLAYAVNSEAVKTVIVDGDIVMRDRVLTKIDETDIKAEIREEAERYLRDHVPLMERVARRYESYWQKTHMRAAATVVPASHAPVRLACACSEHALIHTCGRLD